jgi:acetyltransferase-like isoleucine patch superfamily enzyme
MLSHVFKSKSKSSDSKTGGSPTLTKKGDKSLTKKGKDGKMPEPIPVKVSPGYKLESSGSESVSVEKLSVAKKPSSRKSNDHGSDSEPSSMESSSDSPVEAPNRGGFKSLFRLQASSSSISSKKDKSSRSGTPSQTRKGESFAEMKGDMGAGQVVTAEDESDGDDRKSSSSKPSSPKLGLFSVKKPEDMKKEKRDVKDVKKDTKKESIKTSKASTLLGFDKVDSADVPKYSSKKAQAMLGKGEDVKMVPKVSRLKMTKDSAVSVDDSDTDTDSDSDSNNSDDVSVKDRDRDSASDSDDQTGSRSAGLKALWFENITKYFAHGNNKIDNAQRAQLMGLNDGVRVAPGANIRVDGSHLFGSDIHIGLFTYINGHVTIDDEVTIGPQCTITSNNHQFNPSSQNFKGMNVNKPIHIKRGCWVAAGVTIVAGVTVGECSLVCAGAVVTHDVPDYSIVAGIPARVVGAIDPTTGAQNWY